MKHSHCHVLLHYAVSAALWQEKEQHYWVVISSLHQTRPCSCWDSVIFMLLCTATSVKALPSKLYGRSSSLPHSQCSSSFLTQWIQLVLLCWAVLFDQQWSTSQGTLCFTNCCCKAHFVTRPVKQRLLCFTVKGMCIVTLCHSTPVLLWSLCSWAAQVMGQYGYTICCALHAHACNVNHL